MKEQSFAELGLPDELFEFSGQSTLETWSLKQAIELQGWRGYDRYLSHEPELCFQRIRELADNFSTWQHRAKTGRPPISDRTHIIGLLLKQFLQATFRQTESYLRCFGQYFRIERCPDANTLSLHNRTRRMTKVLRRFHKFVLLQTGKRKAVVATDATGFSNRKQVWSQTDHGLRATQPWLKTHAVVEVPTLLYLNSTHTRSNVHDSQAFGDAWSDLPENIQPIRSLADAAYTSNVCAEIALAHGATPLHALKKSSKHRARPATAYERMINFGKHWPNRFRALTAPRKLIEAAFHVTKLRFGDRLKCRTKVGRENEVYSKQTSHNVRMVIAREMLSGSRSF